MIQPTDGKNKLKEALSQAAKDCYDPAEAAEAPLTFSPEFEARMKRVRRRTHRARIPFATVGKRLATVALALMMVLVTVITIDAIQGPHPHFITEYRDGAVHLYYSERDAERSPETIETSFSLEYVPFGYYLEHMVMGEEQCETTYRSVAGHRIVLFQYRLDRRIDIDLAANGMVAREIYQGDDKLLLCLGADLSIGVWNDGKYVFVLYVYDSVTEERLQKMMASLDEK